MSSAPTIPALRGTVTVGLPLDQAFRLFHLAPSSLFQPPASRDGQ